MDAGDVPAALCGVRGEQKGVVYIERKVPVDPRLQQLEQRGVAHSSAGSPAEFPYDVSLKVRLTSVCKPSLLLFVWHALLLLYVSLISLLCPTGLCLNIE